MRRYSGKRDPWAVALLGATVLVTLVTAIAVIVSANAIAFRMASAVLLVGAGVFVLLMLLRTHYDLGDGRLRVQHGLLRWTIPLREIHSVSRIHSLVSSAALSRDRIRIEYGHGRAAIEIAPADHGAFLGDLRAMSPGIKVQVT